jgi:hypothetical protein
MLDEKFKADVILRNCEVNRIWSRRRRSATGGVSCTAARGPGVDRGEGSVHSFSGGTGNRLSGAFTSMLIGFVDAEVDKGCNRCRTFRVLPVGTGAKPGAGALDVHLHDEQRVILRACDGMHVVLGCRQPHSSSNDVLLQAALGLVVIRILPNAFGRGRLHRCRLLLLLRVLLERVDAQIDQASNSGGALCNLLRAAPTIPHAHVTHFHPDEEAAPVAAAAVGLVGRVDGCALAHARSHYVLLHAGFCLVVIRETQVIPRVLGLRGCCGSSRGHAALSGCRPRRLEA